MAPQPSPPSLLSQHQFNRYTAAWSEAVEYGDTLPDIFKRKSQPSKLVYVSFPLQSIVWLLSTVGVRHIQAAFLVKPDDTAGADPQRPHFSLAFFATDATGGRISAYYLGDNSSVPAPKPDAEAAGLPSPGQLAPALEGLTLDADSMTSGPVPHGIAAEWLANWANPHTEPNSAMFTTNYGPLEGYIFDINDFLDPMFFSQPFAGKVLRIGFGLHEYYALANNGSTPTQTFGLTLRIYNEQGQVMPLSKKGLRMTVGDAVGDGPVDDTFYDLTHPYPPGAGD